MNIFDIINEPEDTKEYRTNMSVLKCKLDRSKDSSKEIQELNKFLHRFENIFYICLRERRLVYANLLVNARDNFLASVFEQTPKIRKFENIGYKRLILSFVNTTFLHKGHIGRF